jgi:2-polyprenyl-3-methyl-5-hydroxy-6-metoxy-1,4-benzoquinol methylase
MTSISSPPPIEFQESFWNRWNTEAREEQPLDRESLARAAWVVARLRQLQVRDARIIDIGCGTGWLSDRLTSFGSVVATDLAGDVIERARSRYTGVSFAAGDFAALEFPGPPFDAAVCLETLSHVADQQAFVDAIADVLRPGGHVLLTTQNRTVMSRLRVPPPGPGQIRNWVDGRTLRRLLASRFEAIQIGSINVPGRGRLEGHRFVPASSLAWAAGRAGLGKTLVAKARKR